MEIFYFNTQGEKIGPITKEGLINLAEAGVITEETVFEISGKKVKGKHIKNLRPIFERRKEADSTPTAVVEQMTHPEQEDTFNPSAFDTGEPEPGTDALEDIYQTAALEAGPSDAAKAAYQYREQKNQDNPVLDDTFDDGSILEKDSFDRNKTKSFISAFKKRLFPKFRLGKRKSDIPEPQEEIASTGRDKKAEDCSKDRVFTKFWRGYRLLTIFLHIIFVILILFCLAGLYKGARWKIVGTMGYRSLNSSLKDLLKTHKYEEFAQEVDRLSDVHPFRRIEGTLNKWIAPTSFEERTEMLLSGKDNKVQSFEEMIAYLKKATDVTYESEVFKVKMNVEELREHINDQVKASVEKQRDRVNDLRKQIEEVKARIRAREQQEKPRETQSSSEKPSPSTERTHRSWDDITTDEPKKPKDPLQEMLRELEEQLSAEEARLHELEELLKKEEDHLKAEEVHLHELESATTLKDRGKIIDTLAPDKAKPYETEEEIVVTPKSVSELHDIVHSYMKMMSVLFDDIHKTGENIYNLHKVHAVEILGGYLLLLFLCYFTATRVRMAEETQKTRLILEERLITGNSNNGNS